MTEDDVEILARTRGYDGYLKVDKYRLRHRRHDGGWGGEIDREMIERGHAVAVLPYDAARDEVVLIEQFRLGAYAAGRPPWQIEIVAGIIEPGEEREDVGRRETLEEAGCAIGELVHICDFLTSPGVMSETVAVYCGRTDASNAGGVFGVAEEGEDIRAFVISTDEALSLLADGTIVNSPAIVALQWLGLNRDDLRRRWGADG
jgi:ADP-ribose pyrophosphatase